MVGSVQKALAHLSKRSSPDGGTRSWSRSCGATSEKARLQIKQISNFWDLSTQMPLEHSKRRTQNISELYFVQTKSISGLPSPVTSTGPGASVALLPQLENEPRTTCPRALRAQPLGAGDPACTRESAAEQVITLLIFFIKCKIS